MKCGFITFEVENANDAENDVDFKEKQISGRNEMNI